jgi:release factor glutamine methyltransferase
VGDATVGDLLHEGIVRLRAAGSELPRLDAELLLGHATGLDRVAIVAHPEARVRPADAARYDAALARRARGEPVAYIRGIKEFRGLTLHVDARALIPRPETELLVELAEHVLRERLGRPGAASQRVADVGTGSGAIPIALATALREQGLLERVEILATELSAEALAVAAGNVQAHGLAHRIRLAQADLLPDGEPVLDVILANLPYIPSGDFPALPVAVTFEPRSALDGGPDGLAVIRRLLARLPSALVADGVALLEIGADQAERISAAAAALGPGWRCRIEEDLSGLPRVAVLERRQLDRSGIGRGRKHEPLVPPGRVADR